MAKAIEIDEYEEEMPSIILVPVDKLTVHPLSLKIYGQKKRKKEMVDLANSIVEDGQLEPITINSRYEILSGARRHFAVTHYTGIRELKAIMIDDHPDEGKIIITHNQHRIKTLNQFLHESEYLLGILGKKQGRRRDLLGDDENGFGKIGEDRFATAARVMGGEMSASKLRQMINLKEFEKESKENLALGLLDKVFYQKMTISNATKLRKDAIKERKEQTERLKRKNIHIIPIYEGFKLYNKSSIDMSEVESNSVQVVFTSPPYYQLRDYGNSKEGKPEIGHEDTVQKYIASLSPFFKEVYRVLNMTGSFFLNIGDTFNKGENLLVPTRLILQLCDKENWFFVNEIIWRKSNVIPQGTPKRLKPSYEKIFHLVKDPEHYYYKEFKADNENEMSVIKAPSSRTASTDTQSKGRYILSKPYTKFSDFFDKQTGEDIFTGSNAACRQRALKETDSTKDHPAVMPTYLPIIPILTTSKDGQIVLDPFSGSGTVGQAALIFNRKYIGYELNPDFYELSKRDLQDTVDSMKKPMTSPGGRKPPVKGKGFTMYEEEPWDSKDGLGKRWWQE